MNLNHLAVFHAVAEAGSVTGAAGRLMVSQPAVSKQVKLLERELGVALFERGARGVVVTGAGEVLAGYARRIFGLVEEAGRAVDDLQGLRRGRLVVGVSPSVGAYVVPKILVRFRQRFPGVEVKVRVGAGEVLRGWVEERAVDFALTEAEVRGAGLEVKKVMEDELVVIGPRGHRLVGRRGVSVADVRGEALVGREGERGSLTERVLGVEGGRVLVLGSTAAVKEAVAEGLGLAVVSRMVVEGEVAAGRVGTVNVKGGVGKRNIYSVRVEGRRVGKAEWAFGCLLKHVARGGLPPLGGRGRHGQRN